MKTDLEKFIELYKCFGIELEVSLSKIGDGWYYNNSTLEEYKDQQVQTIELEEGFSKKGKFVGYGGFFSEVYFTLDGEFIGQGFWE